MCEGACRENIYTLFANQINKFSNHLITKEDLYNSFVGCVEMSNEEERSERINYINKIKELTSPFVPPYSNWKEGLKIVQE